MSNNSNDMCPSCKVHIDTNLINCPLCGKHINFNDGLLTNTSYCNPYHKKQKPNLSKTQIISRFILWGVIICMLINAFALSYSPPENFAAGHFWSIYMFFAYIISNACILRPIRIRQFKWQESFNLMFLTSLYIAAVDFSTGLNTTWSVAYVLPFMLSALSVFMILFTFIAKNIEPANSMMTFMVMVLFSIAYFILSAVLLFAFEYKINLIVTFVAFVITLAAFLYVLLFKFKDYRKGFLKKFHL